jgi:flagellar basal body rod protein FlgG
MESLELLANNLSNAGTGGYKSDQEFYGLYRAAEADPESGDMPVLDKHWTDFSQGTLNPTGAPLDVALEGKGFFAVNGPSGPLYTRNGSFRTTPAGQVVTSDGYAVRSKTGTPMVLNSGESVDISTDGTVTQNGNVIGQLEVVDFTSTAGLSKQGKTYFRQTDAKAIASPSAASIAQGKIEGSNTGQAEAAVRLVGVMRQFEMMQKAVTLGMDMNRRAIEDVARVTA